MPRVSAEARAAAAWLVGGRPPAAPAHLSRDAKRLWREVTGCRPADYFRPGAAHLLEQLCELIVIERGLTRTLAEVPVADKQHGQLTRRLCALVNVTVLLATKLRLTPSASLSRKSTMPDETALGSDDPLLGVAATWPQRKPRPN